jgi:rhodanese-related sulfurtransferase
MNAAITTAQEAMASGDHAGVRAAPQTYYEMQTTQRDYAATGAIHVQRGLLEFKADPASPAFDPKFGADKTIVLYCASGGHSGRAAAALRDDIVAGFRTCGRVGLLL